MRVITALAVLPSVLLVAACSSSTDGKQQQASAWACEALDVPMGEVVRCTQTVAANDTQAQTPSPADTTGAVQIHTYGLPDQSGDSDAGAPPASSDSPAPPPPTSYGCAPGETSSDCPDAPPSSTPLPSSPDECSYMPDLPYCASGGASSSPPAGTGGGWTCTKDMNGNKVCETTPSCGAGAHPSACGACVADDEPGECVPPSEGGCWVTGGGFIVEPSTVPAQAAADGHDNFGGNAKQMKSGTIQGHWNHVDHGTMNHLNGRPEYIYCRHVDEPGPGGPGAKKGFDMNQIYFGGHAKWGQGGGQDGYWFDVVAKDHGEPGSQPSPKNGFMVDTYHFSVRKMDDPQAKVSGAVVYEVKGGLVGGNIQMHPPNGGHPGFQSPLPAWVGLEP